MDSSDSVDDLSSFDEIIAEKSVGKRSSMLLSSHFCFIHSSLCLAMEGLMTTLFTPPGCDWSNDDNNSVVDFTDAASLALAVSRTESETLRTRMMSPHKVCNLWKKKRKAEKKRLLALRQQEDLKLYSSIKLDALRVQRSYERKVTGDDSDEERNRATYEKYGRRVEFVRDLRQ